jgi:6,7-dimethyl-8-ribityllumazine synthase
MIKVGIVTSRWNSEITEKLEEGAISYLESCEGVEIFAALVPGAMEIPLAAQAFLEAGCEGVVVLGAVIRGETSHFDYVCKSVTDGVTRLMLDYRRPIGFGVLTTENEEQALARTGGELGNKGEEAAQVVMEMIGLTHEIPAAMEAAMLLVNQQAQPKNLSLSALTPKKTSKAKPKKATKGAVKVKKTQKKSKK